MNQIFLIWRNSLQKLLSFYDGLRWRPGKIFGFLFFFFILVNLSCYWLGISLAFPEYLQESKIYYYIKLQFPVVFLGAVFDSLSFYVTIFIIRKALASKSNKIYVSYLSIDLLIAAAATAWILMVFYVSGWIIGHLDAQLKPANVQSPIEREEIIIPITAQNEPRTLTQRAESYKSMFKGAINNPLAGRNFPKYSFWINNGTINTNSNIHPSFLIFEIGNKSFSVVSPYIVFHFIDSQYG